jgi:bacterioferritin-associated ferredoxin
MDIKSNITHRAELRLNDDQMTCSGSFALIEKINKYKQEFGHDPKLWPVRDASKNPSDVDNYDILINEFILKSQGKFNISYKHEEICHCRTVPTETVMQSIKQGCRSLKDIARATKAGTGCGTCANHLLTLLEELLK